MSEFDKYMHQTKPRCREGAGLADSHRLTGCRLTEFIVFLI